MQAQRFPLRLCYFGVELAIPVSFHNEHELYPAKAGFLFGVPMKIIGITGRARSGKDTLAEFPGSATTAS